MNGQPYLTPRIIFDSELTKAAIERGCHLYNRRTKFGKEFARLIKTAEWDETERQAAIERSGVVAARQHLYFAAHEIEQMAYAAVEIEPRTMVGVLVQARALSAYAEAEIDLGHHRGRSGQVVGMALAQSVSRLMAAAGKAVQS